MKRNDGSELSCLTHVEARMRHPAAFAVLIVGLMVPGLAFADLASPEQEACFDKRASDACARPDGSPGACVARVVPGKNTIRLFCDAAPASSATPAASALPVASATPTSAPASSPAASPTSSASPVSTAAPPPDGGCAFLPRSRAGGALGAVLCGLAVAALAARKKRP